MIKRALISVFDKNGIVELAKELYSMGVEILSTGGTGQTLMEAGVMAKDISEHTGFPEMMDGRIKTLHPKIHGALLALRENIEHMRQAKMHGIEMIDMVVVNLYPFEDGLRKKLPHDELIELIDIGGPSMLRSAAKNFKHIIVVTDPADYSEILKELKEKGDVSQEKRRQLAAKVFEKTAAYDSNIQGYLSKELFPLNYTPTFRRKQSMRYGENPHQDACFYIAGNIIEPCISNAEQFYGKELSYNNIMDSDAAIEIVKEFKNPCAAVIKHSTPSGVAVASTIEEALKKAYDADPMSAFGCVIALNRQCNVSCAEFLRDKFIEVIIAVDFDQDAFAVLAEKKNRRILKLQNLMNCYGQKCRQELLTTKKVVGGLLVQTRNFPELCIDSVKVIKNTIPTKDDVAKLTKAAREGSLKELMCVTKKEPTQEQLRDMLFAMKVCKHVKSNSVLYAKDLVTVGIGAGQMSRVDATIIATRKSAGRAKDAIMCSDAFFPFRDGIDEAAKSGIAAIIQPGGSIRDREVIDAADEHGLSMTFSGTRLFLH